jgi:hypothetical protein
LATGDPLLGEPEAFDVGRAAGGDQYFVGVDRRLLTIACDREGNAGLGHADRPVR